MELSNIALTPPKILLYGPPGTGKTAFATSAGAGTQIIDLDLGIRTASTFKDSWTSSRSKIDVIQISDSNPLIASSLQILKSKLLTISDQCSKSTYPYRLLVVDSLSAIGDMAMRSVMSNSGGLDNKREIQHWGLAIKEVENCIFILRTLPIAVILIAHAQRDKIGTQDIVEVAIFGKNLPSGILRHFDEVWFSYIEPGPGGKDKYRVQTSSDAIKTARTRSQISSFDTSNGLLPLLTSMNWSLTPTPAK